MENNSIKIILAEKSGWFYNLTNKQNKKSYDENTISKVWYDS